MTITILTPIYNRKYLIDRLYKSLLNQTAKNFEWMIVDDGSTDGIDNWIKVKQHEGKIKIIFLKQENGGKHRALNNAIPKINSELTFIVDSDDYLSADAIQIIDYYYDKYKYDKKICGFSFLRCFEDGKINGPLFKTDEYRSDYIKCRINENNWGDKAEVYFTDKLVEYPFLEVPGEKFLSECYVWAQLALKYDMIHINRAIYIGEYLKDGLTSNMNLRKYNSPVGYSQTFNVMCNSKTNLKNKIKFTLIYIAYSIVAKIPLFKQLKKSNSKFLFIILFPLGIVYRIFLKLRIIKGNVSGKRK